MTKLLTDSVTREAACIAIVDELSSFPAHGKRLRVSVRGSCVHFIYGSSTELSNCPPFDEAFFKIPVSPSTGKPDIAVLTTKTIDFVDSYIARKDSQREKQIN